MKKIKLFYQQKFIVDGEDVCLIPYYEDFPRLFLVRASTSTRAVIVSDPAACKDVLAMDAGSILTDEHQMSYTAPSRLCIGFYRLVKDKSLLHTQMELAQRLVNMLEDTYGWARSEILEADPSDVYKQYKNQHKGRKLPNVADATIYILRANARWYRFIPLFHAVVSIVRACQYLRTLPADLNFESLDKHIKPIKLGKKGDKRYRDLLLLKKNLGLLRTSMANYSQLIKGNTLRKHWENWDTELGIHTVAEETYELNQEDGKQEAKLYRLMKKNGFTGD